MNQEQISTPHRRIKRKRGGQQGNQNARTHGFYSGALNISEINALWDYVNRNGIAPEIAVLNVKLRSLLQSAPGNRRALGKAVRLLTAYYSAKYRLDKTDSLYLKKLISRLVQDAASHSPEDIIHD